MTPPTPDESVLNTKISRKVHGDIKDYCKRNRIQIRALLEAAVRAYMKANKAPLEK